MNETFGIELDLIVNKLTSKMNRVTSKISNFTNNIKKNEKIKLSVDSQEIEKQIDSLKEMLNHTSLYTPKFLDRIKNEISDLETELVNISNIEIDNPLDEMEEEVEILESKVKGLFNTIDNNFLKSSKRVGRYILSLAGIQSIFGAISKAQSAWQSQDSKTQAKMSAGWTALGAMMSGITNAIADFTIKSVKYLNIFIKAMTGIDLLANATKKSIDNLTNSQKKYNNSLSSLDEIENLDMNNDIGNIDTSWIDIMNDVKLNENWINFFTRLGNALSPVWDWFHKIKEKWDELDDDVQQKLIVGGLGMLAAVLFPKIVIGALAIFMAIEGLDNLLNGDFTDSIGGAIEILGAGGLIGIITGKGGLCLAVASVIDIIVSLCKLFDEDLTNDAEALITLLIGTGGLIGALTIIKGGFAAINWQILLVVVAVGMFIAGFKAVKDNWSNMSAFEKAISVIGLVTIAVTGLAIAVGALQSAWSLGIAAAAIVAGVVAISAAVKSSQKDIEKVADTSSLNNFSNNFSNNIPSYDVGTNYVPNDQLAMVHKGEAIVPKQFNSAEFFGQGNEETNALLKQLIALNSEKEDIILNIDSRELAKATFKANQEETNRRNSSNAIKVY